MNDPAEKPGLKAVTVQEEIPGLTSDEERAVRKQIAVVKECERNLKAWKEKLATAEAQLLPMIVKVPAFNCGERNWFIKRTEKVGSKKLPKGKRGAKG